MQRATGNFHRPWEIVLMCALSSVSVLLFKQREFFAFIKLRNGYLCLTNDQCNIGIGDTSLGFTWFRIGIDANTDFFHQP